MGHLSALDSVAQDLVLGTGIFRVASQRSGRRFASVGCLTETDTMKIK